MKRTIIALLTVVMLIMMMLPTDIAVARGHGGHGPTATNETTESLIADFTFDIPTCPFCAGITFTDKSSGGALPYTYCWDFGDGSNSTEQNPTHHYADYGDYTATLTVTDSAGELDSKSKTVALAAAEITVETLGSDISTKGGVGSWPRCISGCTAKDASITYIWLEADSSCTPGANTSAELWARFKVTRSNGVCCVVSVVDIYVNGYFVDDYITRIGNFDSAGTYDRKITDVTWPCGSEMTLKDIYAQWIIGTGGGECPTCNGNCTDYDIPSKCYYDPGPYEVHAPLIADFDSDDVCYCNNTIFTNNTTGGKEPYSYDWDFGGAYNYTGSDPTQLQHPVIHYNEPGTYTVTLNVTDSDDPAHIDSQSYDVTVYANPTAAFSSNVTSCCAPLSVKFTDESTKGDNDIASWYWQFGDGATSTIQNPTHTYAAGTYNVSLTVTDEHGCSDTETKEACITSNLGPTAALSASPTSGHAPLEVDFTDNSMAGDNPIVDWYWEFGDGATSTQQNPSHTYAAGTYTITLTITDEHGCNDEATTTIVATVPPPPPTPAGGGSCPTTKYLTVDWEGNNTTEPLYSNDCLAVDLLGPSPDISDNLFLERGTHAPVVDTRTYYLIVVRELEEIPPLPEDYQAIVVLNVTPTDAEFNRDIFLTVGLNETQLPQNVLNLTMDYYDDVNGVWVPLNYEAGGPNGVAELTLSAPINHFSIYGVLAKLGSTPPTPSAHFVPSGLDIVRSVKKIWQSITFVTKTGENVTITANVLNNGEAEGTFAAVLKLNGQTVDTETLTLGVGQSTQVSFTQSGLNYGQYEVELAGLTDEFTVSRTITWWLIILLIVAVGLIIWGIVWGRRRRRRATQEQE